MKLAMSAARCLPGTREGSSDPASIARLLQNAAADSLNSHRALLQSARIAASWKTDQRSRYPRIIVALMHSVARRISLGDDRFQTGGDSFAESSQLIACRDYRAILRATIDAEQLRMDCQSTSQVGRNDYEINTETSNQISIFGTVVCKRSWHYRLNVLSWWLARAGPNVMAPSGWTTNDVFGLSHLIWRCRLRFRPGHLVHVRLSRASPVASLSRMKRMHVWPS